MNFLYYSLLLLFLLLSLFMVLLVLIQKGRGGGLSAAFGGVGGNTAFGAKTGDVLTWATSIIFGVFLLLAIGLNLIANKVHEEAINPFAKPAATAPSDVPAPLSNNEIIAPPPTSAGPTTVPTVTPKPNPTPTPPPTPTTNPSTNPSAAGPSAALPTVAEIKSDIKAALPTTRP